MYVDEERFTSQRSGVAALLRRLECHGSAVGTAARSGDADALQVVTLYKMLFDCPSDPGALGLCEAALDAFLRKFPPATQVAPSS